MREAGDVCYADVYKDGTGVVEFLRYEDMKYAARKLDDSKFRSHEVRDCDVYRMRNILSLQECLFFFLSSLTTAIWSTDSPVAIFNQINCKNMLIKISQSLEAARFVFRIVQSLRNLSGSSAVIVPVKKLQ